MLHIKIILFTLIFCINPPKERHFFVGYSVNNGMIGGVVVHTNGLLPIKKAIYDYLKKEYPGSMFSYSDLVITSVSEFKNKEECDYFYNSLGKDTTHVHKFETCLKCIEPGCGCWCIIGTCKYFKESSTNEIFPSKDSARLYLMKHKKINSPKKH